MNQALYNILLDLARGRQIAAYSQVAPRIGLDMNIEEDRNQITRLLCEIAAHEQDHGRPMLTALIVHQGNDNNPGEGFFGIATELGLFNGGRDQMERVTFWTNEVAAVFNHWNNQ